MKYFTVIFIIIVSIGISIGFIGLPAYRIYLNRHNKTYIATKPPKPTSYMVMLTVYDSTNTRLEGGKYNVLGRELRKGHCAADTSVFPIGTKIRIPKLGISLIVQDIGGAVRGYHIDMFEPGCGDTTEEARRLWRRESVEIVVESLP